MLAENIINDNSKTYAKQIHVYDGTVYAEIIYQDKETEYSYRLNLWYTAVSKRFGSFFGSSVREKDLIKAHKWADEQLRLIQKYGTKKFSRSELVMNNERSIPDSV